MDNGIIEQIVYDYIKENLKVHIETESNRNYANISVEIRLGEESISSHQTSIEYEV